MFYVILEEEIPKAFVYMYMEKKGYGIWIRYQKWGLFFFLFSFVSVSVWMPKLVHV